MKSPDVLISAPFLFEAQPKTFIAEYELLVPGSYFIITANASLVCIQTEGLVDGISNATFMTPYADQFTGDRSTGNLRTVKGQLVSNHGLRSGNMLELMVPIDQFEAVPASMKDRGIIQPWKLGRIVQMHQILGAYTQDAFDRINKASVTLGDRIAPGLMSIQEIDSFISEHKNLTAASDEVLGEMEDMLNRYWIAPRTNSTIFSARVYKFGTPFEDAPTVHLLLDAYIKEANSLQAAISSYEREWFTRKAAAVYWWAKELESRGNDTLSHFPS